MKLFDGDIAELKKALSDMPPQWDGKEAILALQKRDYQWRQMEWIGFYFEILCRDRIGGEFAVPGRKYGNVEFDCFRSINWDMKASAIKTDRHAAILNDITATDASIEEFGAHGVIMALVDVDYNDENRTFQEWHSELKGGKSKYELDRIRRNAISRYRKTRADLQQILFLTITNENKPYLNRHEQGRNADGSPRNPKYEINIEQAEKFESERIEF